MTRVVTAVRFQKPEDTTEETTPEEITKDKNRRERTLERKRQFAPLP
jgi:hypothetical protein